MSVSLGGYFKQLIYDSCEENGLTVNKPDQKQEGLLVRRLLPALVQDKARSSDKRGDGDGK